MRELSNNDCMVHAITSPASDGLVLHDLAATRAIETQALAAHPVHTLMRRAGRTAARLALALAPHARTIWVACGPGNNGGDGLEAAAFLRAWGMHPVVTWLGSEEHASVDSRIALTHARQVGVLFTNTPPTGLGPNDLCIDALLGLGANRTPQGLLAQWLVALRGSDALQLALDVPSGLNVDTGAFFGDDVYPPQAHAGQRHTLALLTLKPGLFTDHGRDACGVLWFDDLGCSAPVETATAQLNQAATKPIRMHASHKGSWGDVAVIGGENAPSGGAAMTGAALLAATTALHAGAGRVFVAPLGAPALAVDTAQPELMFRAPEALDLARCTVVCGCGGGVSVREILPKVLTQAVRLILDADALNAIAIDPALQRALRERTASPGGATIITPHPLEAARLLQTDARTVQSDRLAAARALAQRTGCVVVLKGSGTLLASPIPTVLSRINANGNARLATAGSGDVLAGLIGARLASGMSAWDAACTAVHEHGRLADTWPSHQALTAGALARRITP